MAHRVADRELGRNQHQRQGVVLDYGHPMAVRLRPHQHPIVAVTAAVASFGSPEWTDRVEYIARYA